MKTFMKYLNCWAQWCWSLAHCSPFNINNTALLGPTHEHGVIVLWCPRSWIHKQIIKNDFFLSSSLSARHSPIILNISWAFCFKFNLAVGGKGLGRLANWPKSGVWENSYLISCCSCSYSCFSKMSPPVALTKRWKKIKKRCSFSSSDRLVRSKSFTEQDVDNVEKGEEEVNDKYLTVGSRDISRFQGLKEKIVQWNYDLKKRRSSDNLSVPCDTINKVERNQSFRDKTGQEAANLHTTDNDMFVVAVAASNNTVKNAVVISSTTAYSTNSSKPKSETPSQRSPWSSPSPSPPASDDFSDCHHPDNQRTNSYTESQLTLYQDQDSGYDGFCPEKSIYSTGSSDTSSVLSSDGPDNSYNRDFEIYARTRSRPRPQPIYEKHEDYSDMKTDSLGHYGTVSPRATISQATVVNLVKTSQVSPDTPPPLPPRPHQQREEDQSLPPLPRSKPRSKMIRQGAISLPRKRTEFRDHARRRGSYHDVYKTEGGDEVPELCLEVDEKVGLTKAHWEYIQSC